MSDRKESILEAAQALFSEKGVGGTSLGEIAARAGIPKGSLFYYYASKERLVMDVFQRAMTGMIVNIPPLDAKTDVPGLLRTLMRALVSDEKLRDNFLYLLQEAMRSPGFRDEYRAMLAEYRRTWERLFVSQDVPMAADLATLMGSLFHGTAMTCLIDSEAVDPDNTAALIARLIAASRTGES